MLFLIFVKIIKAAFQVSTVFRHIQGASHRINDFTKRVNSILKNFFNFGYF